MPDLNLLQYRPDLRPPAFERPIHDDLTAIPEEAAPEFVGVPPGALGYLQQIPDEPILDTLSAVAADCATLLSQLASAAPVLSGMTPAIYLKASPDEAIQYESEAITSGDSLIAMLLPVAKELNESAQEAVLLALAVADELPTDLPAFLTQLAQELRAGDRAPAAVKITALATLQAFGKLGSELSGLATTIRTQAATAPIDALGEEAVLALQSLGKQTALRSQLGALAKQQSQSAIMVCLNALQRRKRLPVPKTMRQLKTALPSLFKRKAAVAILVHNHDLASPALAGLTKVILGSSGNILQLLQSGIGDISRVGALLRLEWHEYIDAGRNRYLLQQAMKMTDRAAEIGTQDTQIWLSRQGDLTRRPVL